MAVSHSVVLYEPTETSAEVVTAAGFLAGYSGRTREAYTLDLRQFIRWCDEHRLGLFDVTRTHIELYARELEELGRAPATIGRRLSTLAGFYRYATEEGVIKM
jgi:integrase/recombinase XerD